MIEIENDIINELEKRAKIYNDNYMCTDTDSEEHLIYSGMYNAMLEAIGIIHQLLGEN